MFHFLVLSCNTALRNPTLLSGVSVSLMMFDVGHPLPVVCGTEPVNVCVCVLLACREWVGKKVGYT